jgi:hypothetical protein
MTPLALLIFSLASGLAGSPTGRLQPVESDQWLTVTPPGVNYVYSLALDPSSMLYAATDQGVFRTADGGTSWTQSDPRMGALRQVTALAIDTSAPSTVYAATWGFGILKTDDAGETWHYANMGLPGDFIFASGLAARGKSLILSA